MSFTSLTESEKATLIRKACREYEAVKALLNLDEEAKFRNEDVVIDMCKKHNIPFNVLDRILNWAVRDNENMKNFMDVKNICHNTCLSKKDIITLANENFTTVLLVNGCSYVRKTLFNEIVKLNELKLKTQK